MTASFDMIVGARGFLHPGWWSAYYPDDLPEDWRLPFYCNEYRGLLIPHSEWSALSPEFWPEAVENDLACFLEWPAETDCEQLRPHAEALGHHLKGVLRLGGDTRLQPDLDVPLFTDAPGATEEIGVLWTGPTGSAHPQEGVVVGRIDAGEKPDPRAMRSVLEEFRLVAGDARTAYLFLDGQPPNPGALEDVRMLVDLLGYGRARRAV